ncbi:MULTISPECIES: ABC transporter ATP-binding protein [Pseudonocardia]|uniref:Trehalose import ATP-binding protein SugC n=2 Tax=Pseudonocardia TaxID=1847 RepID=A0A1Y2MX89_PSEAH|nr:MULTISPECIES: sn-glycerol-3-phosphate ABC transporter ATP-binding protein UgpC [Pseudonocardia]OSY39824.1 Trehalose import ATP-binding protein SugC [Pseudonocardia autotrophica]TDN74420.1 carbohydrate ABC transporter ATP-binding protein (CUT1 family) [Pseudonocardia autotrophica]BBG05187.1 ABC transporter ATP-binding protein [Pseudonocardia autotrophica]GEC25805.1 ABC transporter ATP-binding protein [Pseudonocardia saturnea]
MAAVTFDKASRIYPGTPPVRAVDTLDLSIADGEFLVLVGPSGSGKSTALRMLAGLEDTDEGAIHIGDRDVTDAAPKDRDIAMVFQSYALYPHMTVAENMGFALRLQKVPPAQRRARVETAAELLDLTRYLDRRPRALSGGQRQRVAMGRAIVREPSVFLMDEPLSNLDAKLRVETRANIAALQQRLGTTTVYVTHDQTEAMTMGDRVAVLRDGRLQQCAPPRELYDRPVNAFVAGFIGSPAMNLLPGRIVDDGIVVDTHRIGDASGWRLDELGADRAARVGVRPEGLRLAADGLPIVVDLVEELGSDSFLHGRYTDAGGEGHRLTVRLPASTPSPTIGGVVRVAVDPAAVHLFHPGTDERLGQRRSSHLTSTGVEVVG